jgi:hypothetical protein
MHFIDDEVAPLTMEQSMEFIDEVADVAVQWSDMK